MLLAYMMYVSMFIKYWLNLLTKRNELFEENFIYLSTFAYTCA